MIRAQAYSPPLIRRVFRYFYISIVYYFRHVTLCISFVHLPLFQSLSYLSTLRNVSSSRQKNPRPLSLLLLLEHVNIVIVHGLRLFSSQIQRLSSLACPRPFPLVRVEMNFPLYYPLFPLHGHSCRFCRSVYRSVMCISFSQRIVIPSLFSRILFAARLHFRFITGILFYSSLFSPSHPHFSLFFLSPASPSGSVLRVFSALLPGTDFKAFRARLFDYNPPFLLTNGEFMFVAKKFNKLNAKLRTK